MPRLDPPRLAALAVALQRIGCEHPASIAVGTFSEPHMHRCQNPNCLAEWQETEWGRAWPAASST